MPRLRKLQEKGAVTLMISDYLWAGYTNCDLPGMISNLSKGYEEEQRATHHRNKQKNPQKSIKRLLRD